MDPQRATRGLRALASDERYEILAEAGLIDDRTHVLKVDDTFAIFDRYGDIHSFPTTRHGLFHGGTRFLSELALYIGTRRPLLLGSGVRDDNQALVVHLTNPDVQDERRRLARDSVHIQRRLSLTRAGLQLEVSLKSFAVEPIELDLCVDFAADYIDVFELRGLRRKMRGSSASPTVEASQVSLGYTGLDAVVRETKLAFSPAPTSLTGETAIYRLALAPGEEQRVDLRISCTPHVHPRVTWLLDGPAPRPAPQLFRAEVVSSSRGFEAWLRRSQSDITMMLTDTPWGPYPYAGVPWFSTPFGRDAIVTALATLWIEPGIARSVLRFLAANQALQDDPDKDAEPGKIAHELRSGELAAQLEIPFGRYYGSVDVTPLFLLLAAEYYARTADRLLLEEIWPSLERAASWIGEFGDLDRDGFVEYERRSPDGLSNQGWKDSRDSIHHADGTLARGAIALCEVQAYVYAASRGLARLTRALGRGHGVPLERTAKSLRLRFLDTFWCERIGMYAMALDGEKKCCEVQSSNAGQTLFTGIASDEHAAVMARTLLSDEMFSGWGVRTLGTATARYNPISYHNGSVWPHDNALIAWGLARYGHVGGAVRILEGLYDASRYFESGRLPELFCGFPRRPSEGPTLYPVACAPQSWSAASPFLLLQAVLGMQIDAVAHTIRFVQPTLPAFINELTISGLRVGEHAVDLRVERLGASTGLVVLRREGPIQVVVES